mgnify:CR=1 FL=1
MKKKGFVLLMMVFLLLSVLPASAAEQRVFDNADLLTAEEEQNLQQFCEDAKEEYDIDFAYLTTKDTEGLSTREYGAQFYIEQNLGVGEDYSGAIFVLDMGEPVRIMDLAKQLIRFYGYEPGVNMEIKIVGLRPGEKLYEELMMDEEQGKMRRTEHNKIFVASPRDIDLAVFYQQLQDLAAAAQHNDEGVVDQLEKMIPTFTPTRKNLKT